MPLTLAASDSTEIVAFYAYSSHPIRASRVSSLERVADSHQPSALWGPIFQATALHHWVLLWQF